MRKQAIFLVGLLLVSAQAAHAVNCGAALSKTYNAKTAKAANAKLDCLDAANASIAALQAGTNDISTIKNDVATLKNSSTAGTIAADIAALKTSVNTLNAAVAALQGQPAATPPSLIFDDSFLKGQATGAARSVSNDLNQQWSNTTLYASFTVTNKTKQTLLLLAYEQSGRIIDDRAGGSCASTADGVPATRSSSGPLDPKSYFTLNPGASITVSLSCSPSLYRNFIITDPTTLSFGIDFYTYSASGTGLLSVSFSGVAAN